MTSNTNKVKRVIAGALRGAGLSDKPDEFDSDIHSWRCAHPDRYGRCKCFEETMTDLVAALRAANMLREPAVPDAATEQVRDAWRKDHRKMLAQLDRVAAERDAALAAVERVRVAHRRYTYYELEDSCPDTSDEHREEHHHESYEIGEFYCDQMPTGDVVCDMCRDADGERMCWPCPTVAALDGAPEPEWEYGYRDWYTDRHPTKAGQRMERPKRTYRTPDNWLPEMGEIFRRRPSTPAGPWLPVEGESK